MKKLFIAILSVVMLLSTTTMFMACGNATDIGILMPTQDLQRWDQDGRALEKSFQYEGYKVDLQFADNNSVIQVSQLENMVAKGVKAIIICAINGSALNKVLERAKEKDIIIMAYDSLIMDTVAVDYYITCDRGVTQGEYIEENLGLKTLPEGQSKTIEFLAGDYGVAGDYGDNDTIVFFNGVMSVLQPYLDSGKLICPSGKKAFSQVVTPFLSTEKTSEYFEDIINSVGYNITDKKLDAVLTSNNSIAIGVIAALKNAGFTPETFPIITGQLIIGSPTGVNATTEPLNLWADEDSISIKNMKDGYQSMSVFKNRAVLCTQTFKMAIQILKDETVSVNGSTNNNVKNIPSYFCHSVAVTKSNYADILIFGN